MSHVASTETKIKTVNEAILRQSLELMAKAEPGLTIKSTYKNYSNTDVPVDAAIHTPELPRGIGLQFRSGIPGLSFIGDAFGHHKEYNRVQELLLSTYHTVVVQRAITELGFEASTTSIAQNHNRIQAVQA